jgi:hypothetical protein
MPAPPLRQKECREALDGAIRSGNEKQMAEKHGSAYTWATFPRPIRSPAH